MDEGPVKENSIILVFSDQRLCSTYMRKRSNDAECQRKTHDQDREQREHMQQRFHYLQKHGHINAIDVKTSKEEEQSQVGSKDTDRASHPLIVPWLIEEKRQSEHTGSDVECPLDVVLDVTEIVPTILDELDDFQDEVEETIQN